MASFQEDIEEYRESGILPEKYQELGLDLSEIEQAGKIIYDEDAKAFAEKRVKQIFENNCRQAVAVVDHCQPPKKTRAIVLCKNQKYKAALEEQCAATASLSEKYQNALNGDQDALDLNFLNHYTKLCL